MKNLLLFLVLIYFSGTLFAQTATPPAGDGSSGNPYQIATLNNLYWVTQNSSSWSSYFIQTADIDASISSSWDGGAGFSPIGDGTTQFTGSYDGQTYKITHLFISRSTKDYIGLFGYVIGSTIKNVKLDSVLITGNNFVGGLIGVQENSSYATNCNSNGSVTGSGQYIGGLIGYQNYDAKAANCYSSSSVMGSSNVGGLIGSKNYYSIDSTCYSVGSVSGSSNVGGLIGSQYGSSTAVNCYSSSSVTGDTVGGLIGLQVGSATTNCYSVGSVSGSSNVGGLIGSQYESTVTNCFWDMQTSGQAGSSGGTGKSTTDMKRYLTFSLRGWPMKGVGNGTIWNIGHGRNNGYPYLNWQYPGDAAIAEPSVQPSGSGTSGDPYLIAALSNLNWITQDATRWDKVYRQIANIDATASSSLDGGAGFSPIGDGTTQFTGSYDGQTYKITHLFISRSTKDYIGLFGYVIGSTIKNVKLDSVLITGNNFVGGLIGYQNNFEYQYNTSTVTNCNSTGSVTGSGQYIGGLIGAQLLSATTTNCYSAGSVTGAGSCVGGLIGYQNIVCYAMNCYSTDFVTGSIYVGGLIGYQNNCYTENCYSTGSVTGTSDVGGLIGLQNSCTVTNCFWDTTSSGQTSSAGGTGKSTTEMKNYLTFTGWSFKGISGDSIWNIGHGRNKGYPYLNWQYPSDPIVTDVRTNSQELVPRVLALKQNYPNPFNPSTTISFDLPSKSFVSLKVFDLIGREVATIVSEEMSAGNYTREWNAANMSSGIYFYRLQAGSFTETKKLVLLR